MVLILRQISNLSSNLSRPQSQIRQTSNVTTYLQQLLDVHQFRQLHLDSCCRGTMLIKRVPAARGWDGRRRLRVGLSPEHMAVVGTDRGQPEHVLKTRGQYRVSGTVVTVRTTDAARNRHLLQLTKNDTTVIHL